MVTETITAEHEPHFGGLLSHSRRFLDQSRLDAGAATLCFQSNNPKASFFFSSSFSVKYHRARWLRALAFNALVRYEAAAPAWQQGERLALDGKQKHCVYTNLEQLICCQKRRAERTPGLK